MQGPSIGKVWEQSLQVTVVSLRHVDGKEPATDFVESLDERRQSKMRALFRLYVEMNGIRNKEKFKRIEGSDGLWEFKDYQTRLLCFMAPGGKVILLDGEIKKGDRLSPRLISSGEKARKEYLSAHHRAKGAHG